MPFAFLQGPQRMACLLYGVWGPSEEDSCGRAGITEAFFTHSSGAWAGVTPRLGSPGPGSPACGFSAKHGLLPSMAPSGGVGSLHRARALQVSSKGGRSCRALHGPGSIILAIVPRSKHPPGLAQLQVSGIDLLTPPAPAKASRRSVSH